MKSTVDKLRYMLYNNLNFKTAYYQVVNKEKLVIVVEVRDVNKIQGIPFEFEDEDIIIIENHEKSN